MIHPYGALWRHRRDQCRRGGVVPDVLAGLRGGGAERAVEEAEQNEATTGQKRYADCGLEDMRAKSIGKHNVF